MSIMLLPPGTRRLGTRFVPEWAAFMGVGVRRGLDSTVVSSA